MKKFRCKVCGEIINEGATKCPVCGVGPDKWEEIVEGTEKIWATEHKIGEGMECGDEEIIAGLRANFEGECTEVGMYLLCQELLTEKDIQKLQKLTKE